MLKVLVTCPPMLKAIDSFQSLFTEHGMEVTAPNVIQTLTVDELKSLLPHHDGWIIGDDPANREVLSAGKAGGLRAVVKWGIGTDNVDFLACQELGLPVTNTPNMFGSEVSDVAVGYVIALARETFLIDREVREYGWPKPQGISLAGKTVALIGYGDIGRNTAKRLLACDMRVIAYDPSPPNLPQLSGVEVAAWPLRLDEADFIVVTCALNASSYHLLNTTTLSQTKHGVRIVNVGRGPVIDEGALEAALRGGHVHSAALDVFEVEPLPTHSYLRSHRRCIFGSHNASNTKEAVERTSRLAIEQLSRFLSDV